MSADDTLERWKIAPTTCHDPSARVFYDQMADALIWTDELFGFKTRDRDAINLVRRIFHYRTRLILGIASRNDEAIWSEAKRLFPNWPGFLPERQSPTLATTYETLKADSDARLKQFFDTYPE